MEMEMDFKTALAMLLSEAKAEDCANPHPRPVGWNEAMTLIADALVDEKSATPVIDDFTGENVFLSNGFMAPVRFGGMTFTNVVAAFQAAKTTDMAIREQFVWLSPAEAVRLGHRIDIRPDWEDIKVGLMTALVTCKFCCNDELADKLLATGDAEIKAGTGSHTDSFWGIGRDGNGENMLGKILMQIRAVLDRKRTTKSFSDTIRLYWVSIDPDDDETAPALFWLTPEDVQWHEDHNFVVTPFADL